MLTPINPDGAKSLFTILFTKADGKYIAALSEPMDKLGFDRDVYVGREVQFNQFKDYVDGCLIINDDGTFTDAFVIRDISERSSTITEREVNIETQVAITERYPVTEQLNVISRAILELAEVMQTQLPELTEMHEFIAKQLRSGAALKEQYQNDSEISYSSDDTFTVPDDAIVKIIKAGRIFKTDE
jgi:hypothetical protein